MFFRRIFVLEKSKEIKSAAYQSSKKSDDRIVQPLTVYIGCISEEGDQKPKRFRDEHFLVPPNC